MLLDAVSFVVDLHRDDTVLEFFEVRRILEPAATAMAAVALEFHRRIAAGSGNTVLCSLIDGLSGHTTRARIWRGLTQEGAVARTIEQHDAICDAIAARRPEVARSWATVHVAGVEDWLRGALRPGTDT